MASAPAYSTTWKALTCLTLVLLADWLFYQHTRTGWVAGFFNAALLAGVCVHTPRCLRPLSGKIFAVLALLLTIAQCMEVSILNIWLYIFCLLGLVLQQDRLLKAHTLRWLGEIFIYITVLGWTRLPRDGAAVLRLHRKTSARPKALLRLVLPVLCSGIFIALFTHANPLIADYIRLPDWAWLEAVLAPQRLIFWGMFGVACWAVLRPHIHHTVPLLPQHVTRVPLLEALFEPTSVRLSLLLFNVLFLAENVLDLMFLWGGATLPVGMSYAQYAHQGAYPLIATALLAALFVLTALRHSAASAYHRQIRALLYVWVAQNIFLTLSSVVRLQYYVAEYSLTYWRLAAFIWMGLVACGLALIIFRMALNKGSRWLIQANLAALLIVLYGVSFMNPDRLIADYNVAHSREVTGSGRYLDIAYLTSLGPDALPALRWFSQHAAYSPSAAQQADKAAQMLQSELHIALSNWRGWTVRRYRLAANFPPPRPVRYAPLNGANGWEMEH